MNSTLYLREIENDLHNINEYIIISFYVYGKVRDFFYLIEIIVEIHVVDIFKLKIFIDFRIRTLSIDFILGFSRNIRAIRKNIKIIKIVVNFRKKRLSRRIL
jgi:hypothetical protein